MVYFDGLASWTGLRIQSLWRQANLDVRRCLESYTGMRSTAHWALVVYSIYCSVLRTLAAIETVREPVRPTWSLGPRIKPPFPAVVGLYGGPTVINNAETIATVPHVIQMGAAAYAAVGTPRNGGTRLFGISGHVERPGVYELPMGYNLKKMIYDVAGGIRASSAWKI